MDYLQKGWIDQGLFDQWFDHFLCYAPSVLLMMEGYFSQYCPSTIYRTLKNEVILMALPPNTTN